MMLLTTGITVSGLLGPVLPLLLLLPHSCSYSYFSYYHYHSSCCYDDYYDDHAGQYHECFSTEHDLRNLGAS